MPSPVRSFIRQSCLSGAVSGILMSGVIVAVSLARTGRSAPGLNAVSHILWGPKAGRKSEWSVRYTGAGFVLNQAACLFWAGCYNAMLGRGRPRLHASSVVPGLAVSLLAYVVDYHVVPARLTPGFELLFPKSWFPWLYAGLAVSLWVGLRSVQRPTGTSPATSPASSSIDDRAG